MKIEKSGNNWILNIRRIEFVDSSLFNFEAHKIVAADTKKKSD